MLRVKTNQFNKVCRLCSALHLHLKCISTDSIISMIEECATVHVFVGDGLPQFICEECFLLLKKICAFRKTCVDSENEFYKSINEEKIKIDIEKNETEETTYLLQAKLEVTDSIKTEDVEKDGLDDDYLSDYNPSDSETLINLKNRESDILLRKIEVDLKDKLKPKECKIRIHKKQVTVKKNNLTNKYQTQHQNKLDDHILTQDLAKSSGLSTIASKNVPTTGKVVRGRIYNKKIDWTELFECDICHKKIQRRGLRLHKLIHSGLVTYPCPDCSKPFQHKRNLHKHRKIVHLKQKPFGLTEIVECEICHLKLKLDSLRRHMQMHNAPKRTFTCSDCPKIFAHEHNLLKHHRVVHQNVPVMKTYLCHLCGKPNINQSALDKHLVIHSNEKPYKCDQCEHAYKSKMALKNHIKNKHLNIRPFVCSTCGHAFFKKRYLEDHVRTHTGEKPFKCKFCDQAFGSQSNLYIHNKAHHLVS